jgi:hypothetical protein
MLTNQVTHDDHYTASIQITPIGWRILPNILITSNDRRFYYYKCNETESFSLLSLRFQRFCPHSNWYVSLSAFPNVVLQASETNYFITFTCAHGIPIPKHKLGMNISFSMDHACMYFIFTMRVHVDNTRINPNLL